MCGYTSVAKDGRTCYEYLLLLLLCDACKPFDEHFPGTEPRNKVGNNKSSCKTHMQKLPVVKDIHVKQPRMYYLCLKVRPLRTVASFCQFRCGS